MYPPPSESDLRLLSQLRAERRLKRPNQRSSEDERDADEVADFLSTIVDTPLKPEHRCATSSDQVAKDAAPPSEATKENIDPIVSPQNAFLHGGSLRKRGLSEVDGGLADSKKTARTRKDSTAGGLRTGQSDDGDTDSFHSILARHSSDRIALGVFKSSISRRLFDDLGDFVNSPCDSDDDPFAYQTTPQPSGDDQGLEDAAEALARLANEPIDDEFSFADGEDFERPAFSELATSLNALERRSLTKFVNESIDDDAEWHAPSQLPPCESPEYKGFRLVRPLSESEESDIDAPSGRTWATSEKVSVSTAATTPSILRRRNAPPTPLSERKRVRFLKKNIRDTCSTAGDPPPLIISARTSSSQQKSISTSPSIASASTSASAPITRATLQRAQRARQARIEVLKSSKFCKILDEYTVRCQLCRVNIGLGVDQVYDTSVWKKHEAGEEHRGLKQDRDEKRAERRRVREKERAM